MGGITIGDIIESFKIEQQLSEAVYRGRREADGEQVAVKVLLDPYSPELFDRFIREVEVLERLNHSGVVRARKWGRTPAGTWFILMDYVAGASLAQRLSHGPLALEETVPLFRQLAEAMTVVHDQHVVHRDLKPANVMVTPGHDGRETVRILDFDIAKVFGSSTRRVTLEGTLLGTPEYAAPELWDRPAEVDGSTDVYALGVMLFETLSGQLPFQGHGLGDAHRKRVPPSLAQVAPHVPQDLCDLVGEMLRKVPTERPMMREVADRLRPRLPRPVPETLVSKQARIGPYRVLRPLGRGLTGEVSLVEDDDGKTWVAKVLRADCLGDPKLVTRFCRELQVVQAVQSPGLVHIKERSVLAETGQPYLIMEHLTGPPLDEKIREGGLREFTLDRCLDIAEALAALHARDIVHRDLKPANVLLTGDPAVRGGERAKVIDFGFARLPPDVISQAVARLTQYGTIFGTPAYMAPEQWRNPAEVDAKADVYALGVMMYELLALRLPFCASSPWSFMQYHQNQQPPPLHAVAPRTDQATADLVHRMLEKDPAARPAMAQVVTELEQLIRSQRDLLLKPGSDPDQRSSAAASAPTMVRRRWPRWMGVATVLAVPLLSGLWLLLFHRPPPNDGFEEMVQIPGAGFAFAKLYLDIREVTVDKYERCVKLGVCRIPDDVDGSNYRERRLDHPVNYVNWEAADKFCRWAGKRLPSRQEWLLAGSYPDTPGNRLYPWGDGVLPDDKRCCMDPTGQGRTCPVGTHQEGESELLHVQDMCGNVREWTADQKVCGGASMTMTKS